MSRPEEKLAIIQELQSRRATLSPDKVAILDELSSRYGIGPVDSTSPTAPTPDFSKGPWGVAGEQALSNVKGAALLVPRMIGAIPSLLKVAATGDAAGALEIGKSVISSIINPLATIGRGAVELASPGTVSAPPPQAPEWTEAAEFTGANLAATAAPAVAPKLTRGALKAVTTPEALESRAASNVARALGPRGRESQAAAKRIAPELSEQQAIQGWRQKTIDQNLKLDLDNAGQQVQMMEDYIVDNNIGQPVKRAELLSEVRDTIDALRVEGTNVIYATDALKELARQYNKIRQMPKEIPFKTLISARRQLDNIVQRAGGFKSGASPAEGTKLMVQRSVADMFRRKVNDFHEGLKSANHEFWLKRKAVDITEGRQLGDVGAVGAELPGRGTLLDDMVASGLGAMIGGKTGAAIVEALNIGRQLPGFSGFKARMQQSTADFMRRAPEVPEGTHVLEARPISSTTGTGPSFPPRPHLGDRFMHQGLLYTFTKDGWRSGSLPAARTPKALPPAPEPPK